MLCLCGRGPLRAPRPAPGIILQDTQGTKCCVSKVLLSLLSSSLQSPPLSEKALRGLPPQLQGSLEHLVSRECCSCPWTPSACMPIPSGCGLQERLGSVPEMPGWPPHPSHLFHPGSSEALAAATCPAVSAKCPHLHELPQTRPLSPDRPRCRCIFTPGKATGIPFHNHKSASPRPAP